MAMNVGEIDLRAEIAKCRDDLARAEISRLREKFAKFELAKLRENFTRLRTGRAVEPVHENRIVYSPYDRNFVNREVFENNYWGGNQINNQAYIPENCYYPEFPHYNPIVEQQYSPGYEIQNDGDVESSEPNFDEMLAKFTRANEPKKPDLEDILAEYVHASDTRLGKLEDKVSGIRTQMQDLTESMELMTIHMGQIAFALEEQQRQGQVSNNIAVQPEEDWDEQLEEEEMPRREEEEVKYEEVIEGTILYETSSTSSDHEPDHLCQQESNSATEYFTIFEEEPHRHNDPRPVKLFEGEIERGESSRPRCDYDDFISVETEVEYVKIFPDEYLYRTGEPAVARFGGDGSFEVLEHKEKEFLDDGRLLQFGEWPVQWESVT